MPTPLKISLPQTLADWVERQVASGAYDSKNDVVRDALRTLKRRHSELREKIDAKLLANLASGDPIPATPEFWRRLKRDARARLAAKKRR